MRTVGRIVEGLEDITSSLPLLRKLGVSHAGLGVGPEAFAGMRECLMDSLEVRGDS